VKVRGIALLMGLVLLAAVSLLALMAANGMLLQRRISGNFSADSAALADATRATVAAQAWLNSRADVEREAGCLDARLLPVAIRGPGELPRHPEFESVAWWRAQATAVGSHPATGEPLGTSAAGTEPPRWIIEELHYMPITAPVSEPLVDAIGYYRIFARGGSNGPGSLAVTESIVARPWEGEFEILPYPPDEPPGTFCRQFAAALPCGMQAWRQRR
jgi:Tfp pilus assembly protein PilX